MAEQVERFTPKVGTDAQGEVWHQIQPDPEGAWVRYSDYEAIRQQVLDEVQKEIAAEFKYRPSLLRDFTEILNALYPDPPETQGGDAVERKSSAEPVPVMTRRGAGESGSPPTTSAWPDGSKGPKTIYVCPGCGDIDVEPGRCRMRPEHRIFPESDWPELQPVEVHTLSELADLLTSDEVVAAAAAELRRATGLDLPPVVMTNGGRQILQAAIASIRGRQ